MVMTPLEAKRMLLTLLLMKVNAWLGLMWTILLFLPGEEKAAAGSGFRVTASIKYPFGHVHVEFWKMFFSRLFWGAGL
jgi:hypothetical protein